MIVGGLVVATVLVVYFLKGKQKEPEQAKVTIEEEPKPRPKRSSYSMAENRYDKGRMKELPNKYEIVNAAYNGALFTAPQP